MPAIRSHSSSSASENNAQTKSPARGDANPYTIRVVEGAKLGKPFEELYAMNYEPEWDPEDADAAAETLAKLVDPRPPRLQMSDLRCVRQLGNGKIMVARVERREKHDLDVPCSIILKATRRQPRRSDALGFLPLTGDGPDRVAPDLMSMYRQHYTDFNSEKIMLSALPWSPWVAGLIQTFSDSENLYLGLEYIPGGTLRALIQDAVARDPARGLAVPDARFYFANLALALEFLADGDIAHCDIKPDNILLGADGYLVLTDFGLAASAEDARASWKEVGTAYYQAPESVLAYPADPGRRPHNVDWWAAGVTLYEMVTGGIPFNGRSEAHLQELIMHSEWAWPAGFRAGAELDDLVGRLLTKNPQRRLGEEGAREVQAHAWFRPVDWDKMARRQYLAPYVPRVRDIEKTWATMSVPRQRYFPGPRVEQPPLHLAHDNRFPVQMAPFMGL